MEKHMEIVHYTTLHRPQTDRVGSGLGSGGSGLTNIREWGDTRHHDQPVHWKVIPCAGSRFPSAARVRYDSSWKPVPADIVASQNENAAKVGIVSILITSLVSSLTNGAMGSNTPIEFEHSSREIAQRADCRAVAKINAKLSVTIAKLSVTTLEIHKPSDH